MLLFPAALSANQVSGELKRWHNVTVTFDGSKVREKSNPNPFLSCRLNVAFTQGGTRYVVPGYFAADGNAADTGAGTLDSFDGAGPPPLRLDRRVTHPGRDAGSGELPRLP